MEISPINDAQNKLLSSVPFHSLESEKCKLESCAGRTLAEDLLAPVDSPPYARAIVEGFIVHTKDTLDAKEEQPLTFAIVGEIQPGDENIPEFGSGEALRVSTGSLVGDAEISAIRPWDAKIETDAFTITRPFPPRFFLEDKGSDIKKGEVVLSSGSRLGAAEVGKIASLGMQKVLVKRKPKIALFASGSEVIPLSETLRMGQIHDCNSIMLSVAVEEAGGEAHCQGIMPDDFEYFKTELQKALKQFDMVLISGGTAVGGRDFISDLVSSVGDLVVDGVPAKSGRPLIMGHSHGKPIVCVAGHPPEALRGFRLFALPVMDKILGRVPQINEE